MHINVIPTTTKTLEALMHRAVTSKNEGGIYCENVDQYPLQICRAAVLINGIRDLCRICQKHTLPYIILQGLYWKWLQKKMGLV